jgi:hypothetical protein
LRCRGEVCFWDSPHVLRVCAAAVAAPPPGRRTGTYLSTKLLSVKMRIQAAGSSHTHTIHALISQRAARQPMMIIIIMPNVTGVLIAARPAGWSDTRGFNSSSSAVRASGTYTVCALPWRALANCRRRVDAWAHHAW